MAYATTDGTAIAASGDYTAIPAGSLTFSSATPGETQTITVFVNRDTTVEANETFSVALGAISGLASGINAANVTTSGSPQTGTIRNDDAVSVSITATDASADENTAGTGTWRITRNGTVGNTVVQLAIDASSTASATDWTQSGATFASRAPGSTGTATE